VYIETRRFLLPRKPSIDNSVVGWLLVVVLRKSQICLFIQRRKELTSSQGRAAPSPAKYLGIHEYYTELLAPQRSKDKRSNHTHLVSVIPDGDANASLDSLASSDDLGVFLLLLGKLLRCDGKIHADIELGNGDIDTKVSKPLDVLLDGGGDLTEDEMGLESDAVDRDLAFLQVLDKCSDTVRLGVDAFDVVVVVLNRR
jgi:hypothetical protein